MTRYEILAPGTDISGFFGEPHGWPVAVAIRNDRLIGALAVGGPEDSVCVSHLKINVFPASFVCLGLIETFEGYLKSIGVKGYIFPVMRESRHWIQSVERVHGVKRIGQDAEYIWFRKVFNARSWSQSLRRRRHNG